MTQVQTDVLVIGSGFGAAAPALRLAEAGVRVLMIEKGPAMGPGDYRQTQDPKYITRFLKSVSGDHLNLTFAEALGGGSGFYEMISLRAPSRAFEQVDARGERLWPSSLSRQAFDPWYDRAEQMLRVRQLSEDEIPRSGLVFSLMMRNLGYRVDRGRYAVRGCIGSGFCVTGCLYGAKQSLHLNYLARAREAGVDIRCDLEARELVPLAGARGEDARPDRGPFRLLVRCRQGDGTDVFIRTRVVVLGGGTVGTAALLLRSRRHLPALGAGLGQHIAFNGGVKVAGLLGDHVPDGDMQWGMTQPGVISYEFLDSRGLTIFPIKILPIQAAAAARLRLDGDPREPAWWGEANVELMRQFRHRMLVLVSLGLTPPAGRITLDHAGEPRVSLDPTPTLRRYVQDTRALLESIFLRNGCRLVASQWVDGGGRPRQGLWFSTAHQVGSCRMSDDPQRGPVDPRGELYGVPGVWVTDGAAIPSSIAVSTSLTILANAERVAATMVDQFGRTRSGATTAA